MFVYVSRTFTTTVVGRRWEKVTCEKCQAEFHYELVRIGVGSSSAPYYIGQDSARQRASGTAQRNLDKRLAREAELVPCPKCRWVNQDLIRRYRRSLYRAGPWLSLLLWLVSGAIILGTLD